MTLSVVSPCNPLHDLVFPGGVEDLTSALLSTGGGGT